MVENTQAGLFAGSCQEGIGRKALLWNEINRHLLFPSFPFRRYASISSAEATPKQKAADAGCHHCGGSTGGGIKIHWTEAERGGGRGGGPLMDGPVEISGGGRVKDLSSSAPLGRGGGGR